MNPHSMNNTSLTPSFQGSKEKSHLYSEHEMNTLFDVEEANRPEDSAEEYQSSIHLQTQIESPRMFSMNISSEKDNGHQNTGVRTPTPR